MLNAVSSGWDYVSQTTKSFFTNPKNHFTHVVGSAKDTLVKGAIAISETAEAIIALTNASEEVGTIAGNVTEGLKFSRLIFGFFQIFTGAIPKIVDSGKKVYLYGKQFFCPDTLNPEEKKKVDPNADRFEVGLTLFDAGSEGIANLADVGAFGISGPIGCASQLSKREFSGAIGWLGKQFHFFRMINAGGKSLSSIATITREIHHYRRGGTYVVESTKDAAIYNRRFVPVKDEKKRFDYIKDGNKRYYEGKELQGKEKFFAHHKKIDDAFRELLDKGSQFSSLLIKVAHIPAPSGLKLGLNLFSAGVSLYNVWLDAREEMLNKEELEEYRKNR